MAGSSFRLSCFFLLWFGFLRLGSSVYPEDRLADAHKKFEFKYSFKPPMLVNSQGETPFWESGGGKILNYITQVIIY